MSRPTIYLSGPISEGGTAPIWRQHEHVRFATEFGFELIRRGFSVILPHLTLLGEEFINQRIDHATWIANDLAIIERCDALYRLPGESKGADMEVEHAMQCDIPVWRDLSAICAHFSERLR